MKYNTDTFIEKAKTIHGEKYDYNISVYSSYTTKIEIICFQHGSFWQTPSNHLSGRGCKKCALQKNPQNNVKSLEKFILKANAKHKNFYDYSNTIYVDSKTKLEIICPTHNSFWQCPTDHTRSNGRQQGCKKCAIEKKKKKNLISLKERFIRKVAILHNNFYDYSETEYYDSKSKIKIACPRHGIFEQIANVHKTGSGCKKCFENSRLLSREKFLERARDIHKNDYNYNKVNYLGMSHKIEIICSKHGTFWQTPDCHLNGKQGCIKCSKSISNKEKAWLDSLKLPDDEEHRQVKLSLLNKKYKVDGYDPITKTVYEFWGDYWHGNPNKFDPNKINKRNNKTFGELYEQTLHKIKNIYESGYNLIQIWESEWNE